MDETAETLNPLQLDLQLCFALYSANNLVTRLYRPLLEPLGLTYPQYLAMMALWERSPVTMGELSRRLRLDSGTLAPLCTRLESRGFICRTRGTDDVRKVVVELTEAGRALRQEAISVPMGVYCQLPLPHDDLVRLKAELHRLIEGLS